LHTSFFFALLTSCVAPRARWFQQREHELVLAWGPHEQSTYDEGLNLAERRCREIRKNFHLIHPVEIYTGKDKTTEEHVMEANKLDDMGDYGESIIDKDPDVFAALLKDDYFKAKFRYVCKPIVNRVRLRDRAR
jgi:hypothetical protein